MGKISWLLALGVFGCGQAAKTDEQVEKVEAPLPTGCSSDGVHLTDLRADFRDIWKGQENADTGKQAGPNAGVQLDFDTAVQVSKLSGSFTPMALDGSCGSAIPTSVASVNTANIWGNASTNQARKAEPAPLNVLTRESITGVVSAAGALAAGGNISLSNVNVNWTTRRPLGLIAGGKITLTNGSVSGDVTYGVASTFPASVTVSGQKSLKSFSVTEAFENLTELSNLVANATSSGTSQLTNNTLSLTGTSSGVNTFRVAASVLAQATAIQISVPNGAGVIIDVTGANVRILNKSITVQGATSSSLLWNFAHATSLSIAGVSVSGSILAPLAQLSFASGSINGVVVSRSFASPGSGTLQYAALNVPLLFGSPTATSKTVALMPAQPLRRGCAYRFSIPETVALTSANACLSAPIGVTFQVAKNHLAPAERELVDAQRDRATQTLQLLRARKGINSSIGDALARYESALGIASADLIAAGPAKPSFLSQTQLLTSYGQVTQGYPVVGYGYAVTSEGGVFRGAVGKAMPNLPAFPSPTVSSATALQTALSYLKITQAPWIAKPTLYSPPTGQLVVAPVKQFPTAADFKLVWRFPLGYRTGVFTTSEVQVDATTGAVVRRISALRKAVSTFDPSDGTYQNHQDTADVETIFNGSQQLSVAPYQLSSSVARTLASKAVKADGALVTGFDLNGDAFPSGSGFKYVTDPTPLTPWKVATEPTEARMASAQWALVGANDFMAGLGLKVGGTAWSSIDGKGKKQVALIYTESARNLDEPDVGAYVATSDAVATIFLKYVQPASVALAVHPLVVGHEYAHALVDTMRSAMGIPELGIEGETGAIDEGGADLFATAMNQARGLASPWHCIPEESWPCSRNIADPHSSKQLNVGGLPGAPEFYKDTYYQAYPATTPCDDSNDYCDTHANSTIVSHWGYLAATGAIGVSSCALTVPALDPDLTTSLKMATNIAMRASSILLTNGKFADYRNATVAAALQIQEENIYPGHDHIVDSVKVAWDAVGLPLDTSGSSDVTPKDNAAGVDPWVTFSWPTAEFGSPVGAAWDFQLADSPDFDGSHVLYTSPTPISETLQPDGKKRPGFKLALPFDGAITYYWRARPHVSGAWTDNCYPVHSFTSSGNTPRVDKVQIVGNIADPAAAPPQVRPGFIEFIYSNVTGVEKYQVVASTPVDQQCEAGTGDISELWSRDPECNEWTGCDPQSTFPRNSSTTPGFVSNKRYWLGVRPVGPPDFDGDPSYGACTSVPLDTVGPRAPVLVEPEDGAVVFDGLNNPGTAPTFSWIPNDGAKRFRLQFFPLDGEGKCNTSQKPLEYPQSGTTAVGSFLPKPPNLSGYCWRAIGIADDGQESPPGEKRSFRYQHGAIYPTGPGVQRALAVSVYNTAHPELSTWGDPSPLPGDSFGKDVNFTWPKDPQATAYKVRLSRWEPPRPFPIPLSSVSPPNCIDSASPKVLGPLPETLSDDCQAPTLTIFEERTTANSLLVPGSKERKVIPPNPSYMYGGPSNGRYCWTVWPLFENQSHAPFVNVQQHCYTSGPSVPLIAVQRPVTLDLVIATTPEDDNPSVTQTRYLSEELIGGILFDYVPDDQWSVSTNSADITLDKELSCGSQLIDNYGYKDRYDCALNFKITPHGSTTYKITAQVFNSDNVGPPVKSDATKAHEVSVTLTTAACGKENGECCYKWPYCESPDRFDCGKQNRCERCGQQGQTCCRPQASGAQCSDPDVACDRLAGGICNPCGEAGKVCCEFKQACASGKACQEDGMCPPVAPPPPPPPPPTCPASLQAPVLTKAPQLAKISAKDCPDEANSASQIACLVAGGPDQTCQLFINSVLGVGWDLVPDAVLYHVVQIGGSGWYKEYDLDLSVAKNGHMNANLTSSGTPAVTTDVCGFNGYYVAVTAIDACGNHSGTSLTAVGAVPPPNP